VLSYTHGPLIETEKFNLKNAAKSSQILYFSLHDDGIGYPKRLEHHLRDTFRFVDFHVPREEGQSPQSIHSERLIQCREVPKSTNHRQNSKLTANPQLVPFVPIGEIRTGNIRRFDARLLIPYIKSWMN
jgi:hypothetical protein